MVWITRLRARLQSVFRRDSLDKELDQELSFHIAEQKAEYKSLGMSEAEADAAARRLFGSVAALEEECSDHRHTRWLDDFLQDTRFALRSFAKSPGFTLVAVLTLALGIGANTAFFSAAYGIIFRPLPYPNADRLVDMQEGIARIGPVTSLRQLARAADYAGYDPGNELNLQVAGEAWRVRAAAVTWNLSRVLKIAPARGRWFDATDERAGRSHVAVLSDRMWRQRFGADPEILGRSLVLDDEPFQILGVMPASFDFPAPETELWVPIRVNPTDAGYMWGAGNLWPVGRLRDGISIAAAQAELPHLVDRIRPMFPWRMPDLWGRGAKLVPRRESVAKDVRPKLFALATASLLLLLIACGNVANLLLARAVGREREFAMREALGARRTRLFRQLLTENLLLVIAGGLAGLASAALIVKALPALLPKDTPRLNEIVFDPALVLGAACAMLLTISLFSSVPVIRLLRQRRERLVGRAITASKRSSGVSLAMIGVELALATALLIGAGLMGRTLWQLTRVDSGVHSTGVMAAQISAGPSRCGDRERCWALIRGLNRELIKIPGVRSVNWSNAAPLDKDISATAVAIEDHPKAPGQPAYVLWNTAATPGYFRALGISLRAGRLFSETDRSGAAPVMIVSESTAKRFWPHESAIGKRVRPVADLDWRTVIGVVSDVEQYSLAGFPSWVDGVEYLPLAQILPSVAQSVRFTLLIESSRPQTPAALIDAARRRFPDVILSNIVSIEGIRSESVADQRSTAKLLVLLAGLGLVLGVAGVYGVISHRAAQRTREIGIRMALGASAAGVVRMVLRETLLVSLAGTLAGVAAASVLTRYLSSLLFGVTTHDPATLVICPTVLVASALLAASFPGIRASRTDPAVTLREE